MLVIKVINSIRIKKIHFRPIWCKRFLILQRSFHTNRADWRQTKHSRTILIITVSLLQTFFCITQKHFERRLDSVGRASSSGLCRAKRPSFKNRSDHHLKHPIVLRNVHRKSLIWNGYRNANLRLKWPRSSQQDLHLRTLEYKQWNWYNRLWRQYVMKEPYPWREFSARELSPFPKTLPKLLLWISFALKLVT